MAGQMCRERELASSLLARWRKEYDQYGDSGFMLGPKTKQEVTERKVAALEAVCGL